jgi:hypothetical protein
VLDVFWATNPKNKVEVIPQLLVVGHSGSRKKHQAINQTDIAGLARNPLLRAAS